MPTGLKATSSVVPIGFSITETAANTFTELQVDLNLSPLDREVFVVMAIDMDPTSPDLVPGSNTQVAASLCATSQIAVQSLGNSNCLATGDLNIRSSGVTAVSFTRQAAESPSSQLEYLGIIATNDFFVQVSGSNNAGAKGVSGKLYGYRARASADIFAALVQSEVLSA